MAKCRPVVALAEEVEHLFATDVAVGDVDLFHKELLQPYWGKGYPSLVAPCIQLICKGQCPGVGPELGKQVGWRRTGGKESLQRQVLGGAL